MSTFVHGHIPCTQFREETKASKKYEAPIEELIDINQILEPERKIQIANQDTSGAMLYNACFSFSFYQPIFYPFPVLEQ